LPQQSFKSGKRQQPLAEPAAELREKYIRWFEWASRLNLAPSRDARASYFRMLANTQPIVAKRVSDPDALAPFWMRLCRESGTTYPKRYLQIGLLGLRRVPGAIERGERPWIAGLATWALEQGPSDKEFMRAWLPVKRLHPAGPKVMKQGVFNVLSQKTFADADIQSPGWWANDPDFPKSQDAKGRAHSLEPPAPDLRESIVHDLRDNAAFSDLRDRLDSMVERYERYTDATGDDHFLVRSFCNVGNLLLRHSVDAHSERAQFAEKLARKTLRYQPRNPIAWGLWRDALFSSGAYDASVALGWETVHRFPNDPLMRNELAEVLIAMGQHEDALSLLEFAVEAGAFNAVTYAILARLLADNGDIGAARSAIDRGLEIDTENAIPLQWRDSLDDGKPLPMVAKARQRVLDAVGVDVHDNTILEFGRSGNLRRLRDRLNSDESAVRELKEILNSDPTFAYAQILAARHQLWHASEQSLPPVAAAFEEALANEDLEKLKALTEQMPRLESLVLLARAILGDEVAARELADRLRSLSDADDEQAVEILRGRFEPVFALIDGGLEPAEAVNMCADQLRIAIYDTNEALSAPELIVA
jgi:tetratricopeptide (TPR) repeat protein